MFVSNMLQDVLPKFKQNMHISVMVMVRIPSAAAYAIGDKVGTHFLTTSMLYALYKPRVERRYLRKRSTSASVQSLKEIIKVCFPQI